MDSDSQIEVSIADGLRPKTGILNAIRATCTIYLVANYEDIKGPGSLVFVRSPGYILSLQIESDRVCLIKNNYFVAVDFCRKAKRHGQLSISISWSPTRLAVQLGDGDGYRGNETLTPPLFPPNLLKEWARRNALAPQQTYASAHAFFEEVVLQLQTLATKIIDTDAIDGFWDTIRDGNKIISRNPKHETEIHPQIRLLLEDLEIQRCWTISPEHPTGSGFLDFLITGKLADGRNAHICVEFKRAHASDLAHGLFTQLPEYMDRKRTDYGVYCVVDFGDAYPAAVSSLNVPGFDMPNTPLGLALPIAANNVGRPFLLTLIFDVSRKSPPSKK